ncbi:hypothetical protein AB0M43_25205 [Longispora sp. NPDC051575]|uniref:hypothetical protein n=1 Tax=Longispora sp. NPDC051575 TaxID=3154943 RepID=UPI0034350BE6
MDLWDIGRLLLRRWFVFVPLLLITAVATLQTSNYVKPEFTATGSLLLVPPNGKAAPVPAGKQAPPGNPWAELGPVQMAQAVTIILESQKMRQAAAAEGVEPGYTLKIVTRSAIIEAAVTSKSTAKAQATVQWVLKTITNEINDKQKAFAEQPTLKINTETLDGAGTVVPVTTGVRRAQIGIAGVGFLLTIVATIIVDALITMIRRRREKMVRGAVRGVAPAGQTTAHTSLFSARDAKTKSITSADTMVMSVISAEDEPTVRQVGQGAGPSAQDGTPQQ